MPAYNSWLFLAGLGWFWLADVVGAEPATTAWQQEFQREALPLLRQFCFDCHGGGVSKGKLAFCRRQFKTRKDVGTKLENGF